MNVRDMISTIKNGIILTKEEAVEGKQDCFRALYYVHDRFAVPLGACRLKS